MERNPYLLEFVNPSSRHRPESRPENFDFEFPTAISAVPNDIVFCGEVIRRQTEPGPRRKSKNPFLLRSESSVELNSGRYNVFVASLRSPSARENRYRRISSNRKRGNGLFGTPKFPIQMELSDIKMRQEKREPPRLPLPELVAEGDSGESCWELVRPLRRRGPLMSALAKASFGCIPLV